MLSTEPSATNFMFFNDKNVGEHKEIWFLHPPTVHSAEKKRTPSQGDRNLK